jgi:hypothetical protein
MRIKNGCTDPKCCSSSGICGAVTFGSGTLDEFGYWEVPCDQCARAWEKAHPGSFAWPRLRILWFDHREYFLEQFITNNQGVPLLPAPQAYACGEKMWRGRAPYSEANAKLKPLGLSRYPQTGGPCGYIELKGKVIAYKILDSADSV